MAKKNYTVQKGILNYHPSGDKKIVSGVPVQWQSKPNEPTTELAYITDKEKELLKTLNLHDKDEEGHRRLMAEMNRGPGGILSLDDAGGTGDGPGGGDGSGGGDSSIGGGGGIGGEEGGDAGDTGPGADVGGAGGVGTGPDGGQGAGGGFAGSSGISDMVSNFANKVFTRKNLVNVLASKTLGPFGLVVGQGINMALDQFASTPTSQTTPSSSTSSQSAQSTTTGLTGFGEDLGDSEGVDYPYKPILPTAPTAPTLLNPVPSAMRPQYEFKRNWWEGNKFVPAPITRIT